MVRSSPCEFYLKYLIVHPDRYDNVAIRRILEEKRLDYIGDWYVESLRARVVPPEAFYPNDPKHVPSRRFLVKERIETLFLQDEPTKMALRILAAPKAKEFVESMLLSGAPPIAIARYLTEKLRLYCTEDGVKSFAFFFWNIELLDSTEIRALLQLRIELVALNPNPEVAFQAKAVRRASYKDPRVTAADLPHSPLSALLAQMRMGVMPKELDLGSMLSQIRNVGMARALQAGLIGGPEDHVAMTMYMGAAKTAAEMLKDLATPETEVLKKISAITIRADESKVPSVKELSGGNHTVEIEKTDGAPQEKR